MIQFLKTEFCICRKNRVNYIIGVCSLFLYCMLLLFSGVGGVKYAASISIFGFITIWFFLIPWFLSPASYFQNRKKIVVSSEHMALMLGVSKRTFVKTRIVVCVGHCVLMAGVIALMQLPAFLIGGERYFLLNFATGVVTVVGFSFLSMVVLFVCPSHRLVLGIPIWCGFCGGIAGGLLGDMQGFVDRTDVFDLFAAVAVIGTLVFILAVLYRYIRTVCEERRGLPKKRRIGEE